MSLYEITRLKEYDEKTNNYYGSKDVYLNKIYCKNIYTNNENISTAGYITGLLPFVGSSSSLNTTYNVLLDGLAKAYIPKNLIKADSIIQIKYKFFGDGFAVLTHKSIIHVGDNNDIFYDNQSPLTALTSSGVYSLDICFNIYIKTCNENACTALVEGSIGGQNVVSDTEMIQNSSFNIDSNGLFYDVLHQVTQSSPNSYIYKRGVVIVQKIQ
jgi:hypothetical protein